MMQCVMVLSDYEPVRTYLKAFDADADGGRGRIEPTTNPDEAMRFDTANEALALWRTPSRVVPTRTDGKPNRPLTAFSIEIVPAPPAQDRRDPAPGVQRAERIA